MEVILKEDIEKLGQAGDVVSVKAGYARNFLFPKAIALKATDVNLKVVERQKKKESFLKEQEKGQTQALAEKLASTSCTIAVRAGEDGKLYGSVTSQDIVQAFKAEGINIDKRKIELPQPVKEVGVFKINIRLHPEVLAQAKVWIVKE